MKASKKVLLTIIVLIFIAGIVSALRCTSHQKKIKEYSTYCMDEIRNQLGEYLENVSNFYEGRNEDNNWYLYSGKVSYEGANYNYYCRVSGKDNAEISIYEDFVSYYDNGVIREKGTYIDGKKEGNWTTYDEEGNIIDIQEFRNGEEVYDYMNDELLLSIYPELRDGFDGTFILGDVLQTNYINGSSTVYYDPYRGIVFKLGEEFDGGLIREVDTDENGYPHSEIILLVKGDENEENRTGIDGFREVFTITAISKENLKNFGIESDFSDIVIGESLKKVPEFPDAVVGQNNQYIFTNSNPEYLISDFQIFDVEEKTY